MKKRSAMMKNASKSLVMLENPSQRTLAVLRLRVKECIRHDIEMMSLAVQISDSKMLSNFEALLDAHLIIRLAIEQKRHEFLHQTDKPKRRKYRRRKAKAVKA